MTTRERLKASRIVSSSRASSSPTMVLSLTSMPTLLSFSVSHRLFVSVRSGVSSSEPMAMISAVSIVESLMIVSNESSSRRAFVSAKT